MVLIRIRNKNTNKTYNNTGDGLTDTITTTPIADCPAMSFVFGCCLSTNKYQKYKSVELGDQLLWGHRLPVTALALSARGLDNIYNIYDTM